MLKAPGVGQKLLPSKNKRAKTSSSSSSSSSSTPTPIIITTRARIGGGDKTQHHVYSYKAKTSNSNERGKDKKFLQDYLVASAFAGIGGMDLAFKCAGFEIVAQIENDKRCRELLRQNFGIDIERYKTGDIREVEMLPAGVKILLVTPPCVDLSPMNQFRVGIHGKETGKIREVFRILKAMKKNNQFVPIVVVENVLNILDKEAMTCLIQAFSALQYEYLAWRTVDLLGALPHSRKRVILVATRDGINPHDILFEANPKCECEEIRRSGEKKMGNEYSSSSAICALCQRSEDTPTIQDIGLMVNTGQINQAPSYHKNPCLLTSSASTYVCEFRQKNLKKRKFEEGKDNGNDDDAKEEEEENPFPCYALDIRDMERLMGFPEGYTQFSSSTMSSASSFGSDRSLRVKLLANAVAVPHSEWIAQSCSNAIRTKIENDENDDEKNSSSSSFLSTRKIIEEKFTGGTDLVVNLYKSLLPECGLIDLKSDLEKILTPTEKIHRYPVLNTYVPLPRFLKYKDTRIEGDNKRRLFKYAERLLQHWDVLEYWLLAALVPDDAQRRWLLRRFGDKVVLNDDNIDILQVADFEESVVSFCEKKGDLNFISGKCTDFLDVDALASKIKKKSAIASDALPGKLVLVNANGTKRKRDNDNREYWPAVALTFPEHATTIKATMKKFGTSEKKTFSGLVSTRDVFVCYFNRKNCRCEWVHESKVSEIFNTMTQDEFGIKKQTKETNFVGDEERKKAFQSAQLWWSKMNKDNRNTQCGDDDNDKKENDTIFCCCMEGKGAIGMRVDIFWPKERKFYRGIVHSFDANSQRHNVVYDDGDEEKTLDFGKEKILLPLWDISKKIKLDRRGGYNLPPSIQK